MKEHVNTCWEDASMWNGQTLFRVIRIHPQSVCVCHKYRFIKIFWGAQCCGKCKQVGRRDKYVLFCMCVSGWLVSPHRAHVSSWHLFALNCFGLPRLLWGVCSLPKRLTATGMWRTLSLCSQQTIIYPFFPPVSSNWFRSLLPFLVMWKVYNIMCVCVCILDG